MLCLVNQLLNQRVHQRVSQLVILLLFSKYADGYRLTPRFKQNLIFSEPLFKNVPVMRFSRIADMNTKDSKTHDNFVKWCFDLGVQFHLQNTQGLIPVPTNNNPTSKFNCINEAADLYSFEIFRSISFLDFSTPEEKEELNLREISVFSSVVGIPGTGKTYAFRSIANVHNYSKEEKLLLKQLVLKKLTFLLLSDQKKMKLAEEMINDYIDLESTKTNVVVTIGVSFGGNTRIEDDLRLVSKLGMLEKIEVEHLLISRILYALIPSEGKPDFSIFLEDHLRKFVSLSIRRNPLVAFLNYLIREYETKYSPSRSFKLIIFIDEFLTLKNLKRENIIQSSLSLLTSSLDQIGGKVGFAVSSLSPTPFIEYQSDLKRIDNKIVISSFRQKGKECFQQLFADLKRNYETETKEPLDPILAMEAAKLFLDSGLHARSAITLLQGIRDVTTSNDLKIVADTIATIQKESITEAYNSGITPFLVKALAGRQFSYNETISDVSSFTTIREASQTGLFLNRPLKTGEPDFSPLILPRFFRSLVPKNEYPFVPELFSVKNPNDGAKFEKFLYSWIQLSLQLIFNSQEQSEKNKGFVVTSLDEVLNLPPEKTISYSTVLAKRDNSPQEIFKLTSLKQYLNKKNFEQLLGRLIQPEDPTLVGYDLLWVLPSKDRKPHELTVVTFHLKCNYDDHRSSKDSNSFDGNEEKAKRKTEETGLSMDTVRDSYNNTRYGLKPLTDFLGKNKVKFKHFHIFV
jgi:hypothetical protein